jgi:Zn-dependent protease
MDASLQERIQMAAIQFLPFLAAVVFHEFGHGLMAKLWGDSTAQKEGRLTLDFTKHIDLIGTVIFPLINMISGINILIGWAKPVPIDPRNFKNFRAGLFFVSLAGPLMNVFLAIVSALLFVAIALYLPESNGFKEPLVLMAQTSVFLNYALGIFNLIPLPPLDGGKVVQAILPWRLSIRFEQASQFTFFLLIMLMFSGAFQYLSIPITFLGKATLLLAAQLFGIPNL